jgi:hypothetical protein
MTNIRHHEATPVILNYLNVPPDERYKIGDISANLIAV